MDSLQKLNGFGKRAVFVLILISSMMLQATAQTVNPPQQQGKMYGDPGFVGEPINLNVVNADIRDILNYITEQYGINFVIDKSVKAVPVTVNVSNVPWNVALDSVLRSQELGAQVNGSILRIAEQKTLADEGIILQKNRENQLDTSPLYTEFIRLNYARAKGTIKQGSFTSGKTTDLSGTSAFDTNNSQNTPISSSGAEAGILGIIQKRLSRRGAIEVDERSNTLIITDVRENIDAVRQLITLLDQPEPQVEIEARIVIATRNFSRDLGVQLAALVIGNGRAGSFSTLPGSTTSGGGGGGTTTGLVPNGIPNGIGIQPNNRLISSIPNTVIGLTTGIFGSAQISALITAGEAKGQAKTIATPRITMLNNRTGLIESGSQIPVTTIQPGVGAVVATTEYVSIPLRLEVTPQITDVGTVLLNVSAENSNAVASGGAAPAISTQRMQTEVMVPDGGTTVIGGALLDSERETQDRTPGLSGIPLLGNLFKRKGVFRDSTELLFFITPRIFRPDFQGNITSGKISDGTRSTTILQPVPLGNPASNSETPTTTPNTQTTPVVQVVPVPGQTPQTNPNRP